MFCRALRLLLLSAACADRGQLGVTRGDPLTLEDQSGGYSKDVGDAGDLSLDDSEEVLGVDHTVEVRRNSCYCRDATDASCRDASFYNICVPHDLPMGGNGLMNVALFGQVQCSLMLLSTAVSLGW